MASISMMLVAYILWMLVLHNLITSFLLFPLMLKNDCLFILIVNQFNAFDICQQTKLTSDHLVKTVLYT